MITIEEYENALLIVAQYIEEQKGLISKSDKILEVKNPIPKPGDHIEITFTPYNYHLKTLHLKTGVKLRVISVWGDGDDGVFCSAVIHGTKIRRVLRSNTHRWKIIDKP